jgi:hypothetical protein
MPGGIHIVLTSHISPANAHVFLNRLPSIFNQLSVPCSRVPACSSTSITERLDAIQEAVASAASTAIRNVLLDELEVRVWSWLLLFDLGDVNTEVGIFVVVGGGGGGRGGGRGSLLTGALGRRSGAGGDGGAFLGGATWSGPAAVGTRCGGGTVCREGLPEELDLALDVAEGDGGAACGVSGERGELGHVDLEYGLVFELCERHLAVQVGDEKVAWEVSTYLGLSLHALPGEGEDFHLAGTEGDVVVDGHVDVGVDVGVDVVNVEFSWKGVDCWKRC